MDGKRLEYCAACGEPTGKAGAGDGSIFWLDGAIGPLCPGCNSALRDEILDDANATPEDAELARLRTLEVAAIEWRRAANRMHALLRDYTLETAEDCSNAEIVLTNSITALRNVAEEAVREAEKARE